MLLETQVRLAGEPIGVRTYCSKKTVYFLLDFEFTIGVRSERIYRIMLLNLHLLLPAIRLVRGPTCTLILRRTHLTVSRFRLAKLFSEKGKFKVFLMVRHVNSTFVPYGIGEPYRFNPDTVF